MLGSGGGGRVVEVRSGEELEVTDVDTLGLGRRKSFGWNRLGSIMGTSSGKKVVKTFWVRKGTTWRYKVDELA